MPCYPMPHLLAGFTLLLLTMVTPGLKGEPTPVVVARKQQYTLVQGLPMAVLAGEICMSYLESDGMQVELLVLLSLLGLGYLTKHRLSSCDQHLQCPVAKKTWRATKTSSGDVNE